MPGNHDRRFGEIARRPVIMGSRDEPANDGEKGERPQPDSCGFGRYSYLSAPAGLARATT